MVEGESRDESRSSFSASVETSRLPFLFGGCEGWVGVLRTRRGMRYSMMSGIKNITSYYRCWYYYILLVPYQYEIKRDRTTLLRPIALFSCTTDTKYPNREQPPRYRC